MKYNQEYDYANSRLQGSFVQNPDGKFVQFGVVRGDGTAYCQRLSDGEEESYPLDDMKVNSFSLGYYKNPGMNYPEFIARVPKRRDWRQGVRNNNLATTRDGNLRRFDGNIVRVLTSLNNRTFKPLSSLVGAKKKVSSIIMSKDWAATIARDGSHYKLHHRGYKVGTAEVGKEISVALNKEFIYLKESLEEVM